MCGITGFYSFEPQRDMNTNRQRLTAMVAAIRARGPDATGFFQDDARQVFLGHTRLSIQDLSDAGAQPMQSQSGRYQIVFNGEIYNFAELRNELEGQGWCQWRGHSDTEVLLALIEQHGLREALSRCDGMFALALYDKQSHTLSFARDRLGEKPLYIWNHRNGVVFGSELKALQAYDKASLKINPVGLGEFFKYNYVPNDVCIYHDVFKLSPGGTVTLNIGKKEYFNPNSETSYWSLKSVIDERYLDNQHLSYEANWQVAESLLYSSVDRRMLADVNLGAFLSGGIDSTAVVCAMRAVTDKRVNTYSMGYDVADYNEADFAKDVANRLGTHHQQIQVSANDMLGLIDALPFNYDEPFADSSQLPTTLLFSKVRGQAKVILTGDGGDEVFAGYNRYTFGPSMDSKLGRVPHKLRSILGAGMVGLPHYLLDRTVAPVINKFTGRPRVAEYIHKLGHVMGYRDHEDMYQRMISFWDQPPMHPVPSGLANQYKQHPSLGFCENMMLSDSLGYIRDDILTKVDRASMACGIESRTPYLDKDLIAHAWSMPLSHKIHQGRTKAPLRYVINKFVPDEVMNRPKTGFGVPISHWLRHELRDWAESLLSEAALARSGLLNVSEIRKIWHWHLKEKRGMHHHLWGVLMFQLWWAHYHEG